MYTACLFCHADLGRNEAIEAFPVGRRLAYDAEKGRLWVVCRRCERWNLTPQEERWEAMEQAERLYRGTRLRAATGQIGLARVRDGTELVRVGRPLRPEFAAWRYGDQFGRRRRRNLVVGGSAAAIAGGALAWGAVAGVGGFLLWQVGREVWRVFEHGYGRSVVARVPHDAHGLLRVRREHLGDTHLVRDAEGRTALSLRHEGGRAELRHDEWTHAVARLLPAANRLAGSRRDVDTAIARIEHAGTPDRFLGDLARTVSPPGERGRGGAKPDAGDWRESGLLALAPSLRLAIEMAVHEEQERRALDGELRELERAWRDAEEIAAIADDLLLPDSVGARLDQLRASLGRPPRGRSSARAGAASSPSSDSGAASSS